MTSEVSCRVGGLCSRPNRDCDYNHEETLKGVDERVKMLPSGTVDACIKIKYVRRHPIQTETKPNQLEFL
jgi:hypothetical protein